MSTTIEVNAYEAEVREILGKLQQSDRDVIAAWLSKQNRLEVEGPKGFSNCSALVAWLLNHRFSISEANLTTALGNCQSSGHRKIFWKDLPKQDRAYVGGKPNHAHSSHGEEPKAPVNEKEYVNGRRNHAYAPSETVAHQPAEAPDAWQQIIDLHMKEWSTHSQKAKLESELNAGRAAGKSHREIAMALGALVRDQRRSH